MEIEIETMWSGLSIDSNTAWDLMIPEHILQVIFSKLSIVTLPTCRLVCKAWNHLVLDYASSNSKVIPNTLAVVVLNNESIPFMGVQPKDDMSPRIVHCIDFDSKYSQGMNVVASFTLDPSWLDVRISNSCNGLLCIINGMNYRRTYPAVINPMTNECMKLPGYEEASPNLDKFYLYGFGFSSKTRMQYKVVRVSYDDVDFGCNTEICALGKSSKWRPLEFLPFNIENDGVYFDEALYWVGFDEEWRDVLCCFDVENEKFEIISLPKVSNNFVGIGVFNGKLYTSHMADECYRFEVWMMQSSEKEKKKTWVLEFVIGDIPDVWELKRLQGIPWREHLQLIKTCENGHVLCLLDKFYLYSYDPQTGTTKALIEDEDDERTFWVYQIDFLNFDPLEKILLGG